MSKGHTTQQNKHIQHTHTKHTTHTNTHTLPWIPQYMWISKRLATQTPARKCPQKLITR